MIKQLIFDFDGVILDSNAVKTAGFRHVLRAYSEQEWQAFRTFHEANGGLPRYDKFRYFFSEIIAVPVDEAEVMRLSTEFSTHMKQELTNKAYIIGEALEFLRAYAGKLPMHVASGTDEQELQYLCEKLDLAQYFTSIHGSPTLKPNNVAKILATYRYNPDETALVGDSYNDFEAAQANGLVFMGYNNPALAEISGTKYLQKFVELPEYLP